MTRTKTDANETDALGSVQPLVSPLTLHRDQARRQGGGEQQAAPHFSRRDGLLPQLVAASIWLSSSQSGRRTRQSWRAGPGGVKVARRAAAPPQRAQQRGRRRQWMDSPPTPGVPVQRWDVAFGHWGCGHAGICRLQCISGRPNAVLRLRRRRSAHAAPMLSALQTEDASLSEVRNTGTLMKAAQNAPQPVPRRHRPCWRRAGGGVRRGGMIQ